MLHRWLLFAFVCLPPTLQAQSKTEARETLWLVPHTHWEGAVFKTREEYLEIGLPHVVRALTLLKAHPEYRFALDQVCYVKPFLERYPEEEAAFRKFVASTCRWNRYDARQQHAWRGIHRPPDAVWQGLLP